MATKDFNKTLEKLIKEYKNSTLTYERLSKIFPKAPTTTITKKILALISLFNVTLISSQEQAKRLNEQEKKKKDEAKKKALFGNNNNSYDFLLNKELLERS